MGYEAKKTEHSGPKRGNGAYWGYKCEAKKESNRIRRENWRREIRSDTIEVLLEDSQNIAKLFRIKGPRTQTTEPAMAKPASSPV
jgi:hypothetical protein